MHEVLFNLLGGLSLPRKSVVRLTDRPDMTLDVYSGRKTIQQQQQQVIKFEKEKLKFLNDLPQARMLSITHPLPIFFFSKGLCLILWENNDVWLFYAGMCPKMQLTWQTVYCSEHPEQSTFLEAV